MKSECGRYSITKYLVRNLTIYVLWLLPNTRINQFKNFKAATEAAAEEIRHG